MREGGCLCGDLRYQISEEPAVQCYCCCETCQGATGAPAVSWIALPETGFRFIRGNPTTYESSPDVIREFCGRCGTAVTYRNAGYPDGRFQSDDLIAITSSSLDDIEAFPPREVFHGDELPSWIDPEKLCPGARHHHGRR